MHGLVDLIYYVDEAIIQYQPSQVFIYCGENDMADVDTVSPATVLLRFKTLHSILLKKLPRAAKIVFVSLKPSVARWHLESKFIEANKLIEGYIATQKNNISVVNTLLINHNTVPNVQNAYGDTPLHIAIRLGYIEIAKRLLLDWRTNPYLVNKNKETILLNFFLGQELHVKKVKYFFHS